MPEVIFLIGAIFYLFHKNLVTNSVVNTYIPQIHDTVIINPTNPPPKQTFYIEYILLHKSFQKLLAADRVDWILSPNNEAEGAAWASCSKQHEAFDDDNATVKETLARILNIDAHQFELNFMRLASSLSLRRRRLL